MRISDWSSDVCSSDLMAILTGGQVISEDLGIKLENVTLDMLGRAKKVEISKEETTIVDGAGEKADIQGRINQIKIGRASWRERVCQYVKISVVAVALKKNTKNKREMNRVDTAI